MRSRLSKEVLATSYRVPEKVLSLAVGSASGTWVAWGQLYIDNGEETDLALGGVFVNFRAEVQPSGNGMLTGTFSSTGQLSTSVLSASISASRSIQMNPPLRLGDGISDMQADPPSRVL